MVDAIPPGPPENMENVAFPPLWRGGAYTPRPYQRRIGVRAARENVLAALPTGLGKTLIAALLAVKLLAEDST